MNNVTVSTKRNRTYQRKFDWDEARRLREEGLSWSVIARELGVSSAAVQRVCDPKRREQMAEATARYMKSASCVDCGKSCTPVAFHKNKGNTEPRCNRCANLFYLATSYRDGEQRCSECRQWKPLWDYPRRKTRIMGRHKICTPCGTKMKRDWRARNLERSREYDREYKRKWRAQKKTDAPRITRPREAPIGPTAMNDSESIG
jgi:hypothetical protein